MTCRQRSRHLVFLVASIRSRAAGKLGSRQDVLLEELGKLSGRDGARGIVDKTGCVYALGVDTKVLSTIFELVSRLAVFAAAKRLVYRSRSNPDH